MSAFAGITRIESRQHLAVFRGLHYGEDEKPQDTSALFATRVLVLANAAVQEFNALAADRALAQRAATAAALPRQRLAELRALYTAQAALPERTGPQDGRFDGF